MRWDYLVKQINERNCKMVAELGVQIGINAEYMLKGCSCIEKFYAVDMWKYLHEEEEWKKVVEKYKEKVISVKKRTHEAIVNKDFEDGSLDLIFIDACHSTPNVIQDIEEWILKLKPDGLLCGHDINYRKVWAGVEKVLPNFRVWMDGQDAVWFYDLRDPDRKNKNKFVVDETFGEVNREWIWVK